MQKARFQMKPTHDETVPWVHGGLSVMRDIMGQGEVNVLPSQKRRHLFILSAITYNNWDIQEMRHWAAVTL